MNTLASGIELDLDAAKRSLVGTLVGDSLGLAYEGLPAGRNIKLMPFPLRQRLVFGKGFASDDTAQSAFVLQSLMESEGNAELFGDAFGRRIRTWFLAVPPGIGLSTIKACLRLCLGVPALRSGVRSEGNGAAMRAAVSGSALCDEPEQRVRFVDICSRVTHSSALAGQGAQIVALAAALSARNCPEEFDGQVPGLCPDWPWSERWPAGGPSGWVVHSVNAVIELWQRHLDDPVGAIEKAICLGGDTDSVSAMLGGILGAHPETVWREDWLRICGWPRKADIESLSMRPSYGRLVGNHLFQLPIVLAFGFRRLLPPY